ncbi:MAG: phosphoglucomutase/phosphomannomutase family protein, partial [Candidatus Dormiibacterota bacterium]
GEHDLCIATDGDADRVGIIDEKGNFINQLEVFALLMDHLEGTRGQKGAVVRTLTSTTMADELAKQYGVECLEVPVGFKYVGPLMIEKDAVMGGEESGGFGFRGHIPERDGILAGLFFADMIIRQGKPLSQILAALYKKVGPHAYDRRDIKVPRDDYQELKDRVYKEFTEHPPEEFLGRKVVRSRSDDGFKSYFEDGSWVLSRFSGTEPLIRVYSEAPTKKEVEDLIQAMIGRMGIKA